MKNKVAKVIIVAFLANLTLAHFSFAQTPAPAAPSDVITIPPAALEKAQQSPEDCRKFRKAIQAIWPGRAVAKAIWSVDVIGASRSPCRIVPASFPDYLDVELKQPSGNDPAGLYSRHLIFGVPKEFADFQTAIKEGKGISQDVIIKAEKEYLEKKQQAGPLSVAIGEILIFLAGIVNSALAGIAALAGTIFTYAVNPIINNTGVPEIVNTGWTIVRDVCNMFFILILIVIALAAILGFEEYDYKHLLREVILMALLVNFSKIIAVTIMDLVNFLAAVFWSGQNVQVYHIFATMIRIANPVNDFGVVWNGGTSAALALAIGKFLFTLVATIVFLALAAMFVIRLVGLYVLIIFSPIAFVARILPATEKFSEEWWSYFFKYLIWAPVALFMVRLVILVVDEDNQFRLLGGGNHDSVFVFVILAAFMAAALYIAEEAGMVGGKLVMAGVHAAQHAITHGLQEIGGGLVGLAGRSYSKAVTKRQTAAEGRGDSKAAARWKAAQFLNLRVAREAWEQRSHEKEEEAYVPAVGHAHDALNRIMPTEWQWKKGLPRALGQKTYYGRIGQRQIINHKLKLIKEAGLSEEEKVEAYNGARHVEDQEAWFAELQSGRHEDGQMILTALAKRAEREKELKASLMASGESAEAATALAAKQAAAEIPAEFDSVDYLDTLTENLRHHGLNSEQIGSIMAHLAEQAEAEQKIRGLGVEVYEFDGKFRAANDLSGYAKLEEAQGSAAMLKAIQDLGIKGITADEVDIKDSSGAVVGKKTVKLKFDGNEITDFKSFEKAIANTKGKTAADKVARRNAELDLRYEIIGARKNRSADKRMMRGDSERWARAFEPAAFMVQDEDSNFTRFTSYGRRRFANISTATVNTFKQTRGLQVRALKMAGIYKNELTGHLDPKKYRYDIAVEALELNEAMAVAVVSKAQMSEQERRDFFTAVNVELGKQGKAQYATGPNSKFEELVKQSEPRK